MKNFFYKEIDELAIKYGSDKSSLHHGYTQYYDFYFSRVRNDVKNILEIGILNGSSSKMWEEYFPNAVIHGIDINIECKKFENSRTRVYIGDQSDSAFLGSVSRSQKFDIIIDDGSHVSEHQIKTFEFLFNVLNDGGVYVIEDTKTSYHKRWLGQHESCINFFKTRIDDVGMHGKKIGKTLCSDREKILKMSQKNILSLVGYEKVIETIHFYSGLIFVFKQGTVV